MLSSGFCIFSLLKPHFSSSSSYHIHLRHLGALLEPSWGHLGVILGSSGAFWGRLGRSWAHLEVILGASWGHLSPPHVHLWPSEAHAGPVLGHLGATLGNLWRIWGYFWPSQVISGPSEGLLGLRWAISSAFHGILGRSLTFMLVLGHSYYFETCSGHAVMI